MSTPSSDKAAIRQVIRALKAAGIMPVRVDYGDGDGENIAHVGEDAVIAAIMAVDDAFLVVGLADGDGEGWIRFVMGNDPEEVVCDYTTTLSSVLDPLTEGWWNE